jgi:hypothetical protein
MRQTGKQCPIFILLAFFFFQSTHAQTGHRKYIQKANGLIALQVGIPSKAMQEAVENKMGNLGFGLGISGVTNPFSWGRNKRNSPLRIGGEAGYTYYGRFLSEVNINGTRGDYKTSYGIVQLNGLIQLRPSEPEKISPFLEVLHLIWVVIQVRALIKEWLLVAASANPGKMKLALRSACPIIGLPALNMLCVTHSLTIHPADSWNIMWAGLL